MQPSPYFFILSQINISVNKKHSAFASKKKTQTVLPAGFRPDDFLFLQT